MSTCTIGEYQKHPQMEYSEMNYMITWMNEKGLCLATLSVFVFVYVSVFVFVFVSVSVSVSVSVFVFVFEQR